MERPISLFVAAGTTYEQALWRTDGPVTTELLTLDPLHRFSGSSIGPLFPLNGGQVLFSGRESSSDSALWVSNGTVPGTRAVSTVDGANFFFALGGGAALFQGNDPGGRALWRTDGTAAGTFQLSAVRPGGVQRFDPPSRGSPPSSPDALNDPSFTALGNGTILFIGEDASLGRELWRTDGTAAGTVLLADLAPGSASGGPYGFTPLGNGRAVFGANPRFGSGATGELWATDGTAAGTARLAAVGATSFLSLGDGRVLFAGDDGAGEEPWVTDGTAAGTVLLADLTPDRLGSLPRGAVRGGRPIGVKTHGKDGRLGLFCSPEGLILLFWIRFRHELAVCCVQSWRAIYIAREMLIPVGTLHATNWGANAGDDIACNTHSPSRRTW